MPFGFDGPTGTVVPHAAVAFAFTDALADADADAEDADEMPPAASSGVTTISAPAMVTQARARRDRTPLIRFCMWIPPGCLPLIREDVDFLALLLRAVLTDLKGGLAAPAGARRQ